MLGAKVNGANIQRRGSVQIQRVQPTKRTLQCSTTGSLPVAILPPCTPQNEAVLATAHHSQKTCFTLPGRSYSRYLKHHSNMIPPPLQKKATPPSFFTAVQGKYQHPPIHGVALRRAGGKFKLAFWKSSRLAKGSSDLASEQYMSLNF